MNFRPSATSAVYAILGNPVRQSKSPVLHNAVFEALGIDAVYIAHEPADVGSAVEAMRTLGYAGANITMPFKSAVIEHLDEISDVAREMNAVNTLTFRGDTLYGDNTDGAGLLAEIRAAGTQIEGSNILVLGTGGAASAIWTQAAFDGAHRVRVFNRMKPEIGLIRDTLQTLGDRVGCEMTIGDLADDAGLADAVADSTIIINATKVGMGKLANQSLIDASLLRPSHTVADAVYHPRITKLIADAQSAGAKTVEGLRMLLGQAAICEKIWLDIDMPYDIAEAAVMTN